MKTRSIAIAIATSLIALPAVSYATSDTSESDTSKTASTSASKSSKTSSSKTAKTTSTKSSKSGSTVTDASKIGNLVYVSPNSSDFYPKIFNDSKSGFSASAGGSLKERNGNPIALGGTWKTNIGNGASFSTGYQATVQKSSFPNYVTRTDTFLSSANVDPLNYIKGGLAKALPLTPSMAVAAGTQIQFTRQFANNDRFKASTALPLTPLSLPVSAERAKALPTGTGASFLANGTLIMALTQAFPTSPAGTYALSPAINFFVQASGTYQVKVNKYADDLVRVRFVTKNAGAAGVSATLSLTSPSMTYTLINGPTRTATDINSAANNDLTDDLFTNPLIMLSKSKSHTETSVFDYVFDLKDPKMAKLYDETIGGTFAMKPHMGWGPDGKPVNLSAGNITNLALIEQAYQQSKGQPFNKRPIDRVYSGRGTTDADTTGIHVGTPVLGLDISAVNENSKMDFQVQNPDNSITHFSYESYNPSSNVDLFWGAINVASSSKIGGLYNVQKNARHLTAFTITHHRDGSHFNEFQRQDAFNLLNMMLPSDMRSKLPRFSKNSDLWKNYHNMHFSSELYIEKPALDKIGSLTKDQVKARILSLYGNTKLPGSLGVNRTDRSQCYDEIHCFTQNLDYISDNISKSLDHKLSDDQRVQAFRSLMNDGLFQDVGEGFYLHMISPADRAKMVHFDWSIQSDDSVAYNYHYGMDTKDDAGNAEAMTDSALRQDQGDGGLVVGEDGRPKVVVTNPLDRVIRFDQHREDFSKPSGGQASNSPAGTAVVN